MSHSSTVILCDISEIEEGASKSLVQGSLNLFAVKKHNQIYLYENRCPHAGLPLNWTPDTFLDRNGELIQCSSHGALFQIESGRCVAGPCPGRHLSKIPFQINDNKIELFLKKTP